MTWAYALLVQMSRKTGMSTSLSTSPGAMRINNSMAAGGAAEKAAIIFRKHDLNQVRGQGAVARSRPAHLSQRERERERETTSARCKQGCRREG